jgi:hypothetical protein
VSCPSLYAIQRTRAKRRSERAMKRAGQTAPRAVTTSTYRGVLGATGIPRLGAGCCLGCRAAGIARPQEWMAILYYCTTVCVASCMLHVEGPLREGISDPATVVNHDGDAREKAAVRQHPPAPVYPDEGCECDRRAGEGRGGSHGGLPRQAPWLGSEGHDGGREAQGVTTAGKAAGEARGAKPHAPQAARDLAIR